MKKLLVGAAFAVAMMLVASPASAACNDVDGDGTVECCAAADPGSLDPAAPPENICGSALIPGVAEIAGCATPEGIAGCIVVAEQGVVGGDTLNPPDSITLLEDCEERAVQACVDCGCAVPAP